MTFSTSDLGEKSFKEIVYIYTISLTRTPVFQNVISSFRHYVITSLTSFVQTTIKIVVTYSTHVVYRDKKARISLRASCALPTIVNNLKQNYSSLLTQKTMEKRRESKKMRNFVGAFDCIDKAK